MIAVCKKDDIGLYHSFRKGIEYKVRIFYLPEEKDIVQIMDDNGEYYYFNDEQRFNEYFDDKSKLRKKKLEELYESRKY